MAALVLHPATRRVPLRCNSVADTTATDAGNIVAVGNMITDAGDIGNALSVADINGLAVSGALDVAGTYGTFTVFNDGTYLYTANPALDGLADGQHATDLFNFTVTNSFGRLRHSASA
ncbi:VCBS domain-containing protein [Bradyrhizobium ganzhouense]|uniref:VCBS domain-containing protein n=1 Tax=Bradyrhizobium ganzhouense TaxID=1179767 RepID=UPI003CFA35A5